MPTATDSNPLKFWRRIQGRLILPLLIMLVSTFLVQAFIYHDRFKAERAKELQTNLEVARAAAKAFETFLGDVLHQEAAIGQALSQSQSLHSNDLNRILDKAQADHPAIWNMAWVGPTGLIVAASHRDSIGLDLGDRDHIRKVAAGADWAISDMVLTKSSSQPVFVIARAVRDEQGALIGTVIATIVPERLEQVLGIERSRGGGLALVDSRGMLVYRYPPIKTTWEERDWLKQYPQFADALKGREIAATVYAGFEGKKRLVGFTPLRSIGWAATAGRTEEIAMAATYATLRLNAVLFLVVSLIAFGAALLLSRPVASSIKGLRELALRLGAGEHGHPSSLTPRIAEIKELTEAFSLMSEKLNARETALRESESRFRLLSETAGKLLASENPQAIVNELCGKVMEHLDCHAFFNFLVDERANRLHLNACAGIPEDEASKIEWLDYGVAVCGCAARDCVRIVAENIPTTPDPRTELVKSYGIQAYACHPLMAQGRLIGTLSFGTKTRTGFSPGDLALMKTVTDQAAVAMERIRLIEELQKTGNELEIRVRDRTLELNKANAELLRSNQALDDFASIASHDLQEPLRKILAFGERLGRAHGDSLEPEGLDSLSRMLNAAARMKELLTSLLEYSRIASKAGPFRKIELSVIVNEVISDLEIGLERSGGKVLVVDLPAIEADPTQMRQLFQNLIGNALKFHRDGENPVVKIHCAVENQNCLISVEDNGIGFDEKYLERIFAPFQRLHGRSSRYEGTGMGLAICMKIVERHGGRITARSAPGNGACFLISLPATQTRGGQ